MLAMMTGTKSRLFVLSALAATIVALPATEARADEIAPCDDTVAPYKCAKLLAPAPFVKALGEDAGFSNDVDTGWIPACPDPVADPHCGKNLQARAQSNLKDTKVNVTLTSDWVLRWGPDAEGLAPGSVRIGPRKKSPGGGDMKVTYKLYPNFGIWVDIAGFKGEFNFDPFDILKLVNADKVGVTTEFDYSLSCSKQFSLWSYDAPSEACQVKDDDADGGVIFKFDPSTLLGKSGGSVSQYIKLSVELRAKSDAGFTWQTNGITIEGAPAPLNATTDYLDVAYDGSSSVAVTAQAKGEIAYAGKTAIMPAVKVVEIAGQSVNLTLPINVGAEIPFNNKLPQTTIQTKLVFPVPNLKPTLTPVKFGDVKVGQKKLVPIKVANAGDGISKATVTSSDNNVFKVVQKDLEVAGTGEGVIEVEFNPADEGAATGEITIISNNIDGVDQKIQLSGNGTIDAPVEEGGKAGTGGSKPDPEPEPEPEAGSGGSGGKKTTPKATDDESTSDGGCGCRVPTGGGEQTPAGILAMVGLAALALRRRK
jgi:MYXO-CTERM domain-containing protein